MWSKFRLYDSKTVEIFCQCSTMPCIDHNAMQLILLKDSKQIDSKIYYYLDKYVQYASIDIFQEDLKHLV